MSVDIYTTTVKNNSVSAYEKCPKCKEELEQLTVGGILSWRNTIMCNVCFKIVRSVPSDIIYRLAALQHMCEPELMEEAQKVMDDYAEASMSGDDEFVKHAIEKLSVYTKRGIPTWKAIRLAFADGLLTSAASF